MTANGIVAGGCTGPLGGSSSQAAPLGGGGTGVAALGSLVQAALNGNLGGALKGMAIEQGKKLAAAVLMKIFTAKATPKPAKPPWAGMGKIAPPGSAVAAAATAAYISVHTTPPAPGASTAAGGGAAPGTAGGGSGSAAGTSSNRSGSSASEYEPAVPKTPEDMWTTISFNDLFHTAVAMIMMPAAIVLRSLAVLFPETMRGLFSSLTPSWAGTEDKTGLGFLVGNNDGKGHMPGIVGIANSLGHELLQALGVDQKGGLIDGEEFEKGMKDHDNKTGFNLETGKPYPSSAGNSAGQAFGQLLGEFFRRVGLGDSFYQIVKDMGGSPDWYGFVTGVWQGTHQKSV